MLVRKLKPNLNMTNLVKLDKQGSYAFNFETVEKVHHGYTFDLREFQSEPQLIVYNAMRGWESVDEFKFFMKQIKAI